MSTVGIEGRMNFSSMGVWYLGFRHPSEQLLQLGIVQLLNAQQLVIVPLVMSPISFAPDSRLHKAEHEDIMVWLRLPQLRRCIIVHVLDRDIVLCPAIVSHSLLGNSGELLQRNRRVVDIDSTVVRFSWVLENSSCCYPDASKRGRAEDALTAIIQADLTYPDFLIRSFDSS